MFPVAVLGKVRGCTKTVPLNESPIRYSCVLYCILTNQISKWKLCLDDLMEVSHQTGRYKYAGVTKHKPTVVLIFFTV